MAITVNLNAARTALLQAELNEYNRITGSAVQMDQFVTSLMASRADSNKDRYAIVTPYEFISRFSPAEFKALQDLSVIDPAVKTYLDNLKTKGSVDLTDPSLANSLNYLLTKPVGAPVLANAARIQAITDVTLTSQQTAAALDGKAG